MDYLELTIKQYGQLKLLYNAASTDPTSRISLTCMHYDPGKNRVCCTDGHILRFLKMDLGNKEMLIAPETFQLSLAQIKKRHGITKSIEENFTFRVDLILKDDYLPFPDVEKVIPEMSRINTIPGISISGIQLDRMFKTFPKSKYIPFNMAFTSNLGPVVLFDEENEIIGIIMPLRSPDNFAEFIEHKRAEILTETERNIREKLELNYDLVWKKYK